MNKVHEELTDGILYELWIAEEHTPIKGNVVDSGDPVEDKRDEDRIRRQLRNGNAWAWAFVRVTARRIGDLENVGTDYLGCCSYKDTAEFIAPGGYYDDMKDRARNELLAAT